VEHADARVEIDHCEREPIHVPGAIQPQGWLFAVDDDLCVEDVSTNVAELLDRRPGEVLGADLTKLLGGAVYDLVGDARLHDGRATQVARLSVAGRSCEAVAHIGLDRRMVIELEPCGLDEERDANLLERVEGEADRILMEEDFEHTSARLAEAIRRLTGFQRVVIYRFHDDWSGQVVAEDSAADMEQYLGLRFPASDIPAQARRLYAMSPVRAIFDAEAAPSPLLTGRTAPVPLDLSRSTLRAVSPVHVRYLRNMGVRASVSISLVHDGELWGLIACHDRSAMHPSARVRRAASMIGRLVLPRLLELDPRRGGRRLTRSAEHLDAMVRALAVDRDPLRVLADPTHGARSLIPSEGLIVRLGDRVRTVGRVPEDRELDALLAHVDSALSAGVLAKDKLVTDWPAADALARTAAGVLAIRIGRSRGDMLIWLRPEQSEVVQWAGDPAGKYEREEADGSARLQPRESFAAWRQDVRHQSEAWLAWEIDLATRARALLLNIVDRHDAYDEEHGRRQMAESELARARTHLVRQRRAVLAMLADVAESGGDQERLRDVVAGLAPMIDRLGAVMGRREEMVEIERRLADLEATLEDPSDAEAPGQIRRLRQHVADLLDDAAAAAGAPSSCGVDLAAVLAALEPDTAVSVRRHDDDSVEVFMPPSLSASEREALEAVADQDRARRMRIAAVDDQLVVRIQADRSG
jgi:light-regulated signal transduction histidine kinase (bacteriophytochrome)